MPCKINKYFFIFFISLFISMGSLNAQDTTLTKQDTIFYTYFNQEQLIKFTEPVLKSVDTTLNLFQRYEPLSACAFLGNSGKAYKSLLFDNNFKPGFDMGEAVYRSYFPDIDKQNYYNVSSPYTELYYVMGGSKEQILKVIHTQNIHKQFNIALNFNIISSPGTYRRQKTDISNLILTTNYSSKNKRYNIQGNIMACKWYNNENGGLSDINDFTSQVLTRTDLFDVQLSSAQNRVKENTLFLRQEIGLNKIRFSDTLQVNVKPVFNSKFSHTVRYNTNSLTYIDENPSPTYYQKVYFDTLYTGDSTHVNLLSNEIGFDQVIIRNKLKEAILYSGISLEHQYIDHRQYITYFIDSLIPIRHEKAFFELYIPKAYIHLNLTNNLGIHLNGYKIINSNNEFGYGLYSYYKFNKIHKLQFKATFNKYEAPYHLLKYTSNHFVWLNNFNKTTQLDASLIYSINGLDAGIDAKQLIDFVYIDNNILPQQYHGTIQLMRFSLSKMFVWKQFNFYNYVYFQYSNLQSIYPLPLFVNNHSFFWSTHLFKKALYAQTGIDIYYNSAFKGHGYMPAIRQFYVQNTTTTGNYPFFDFFINLRIKRANIFAKLTHLNQGLMGYSYYNVPDYPLQGRAFKLGISWKFYD